MYRNTLLRKTQPCEVASKGKLAQNENGAKYVPNMQQGVKINKVVQFPKNAKSPFSRKNEVMNTMLLLFDTLKGLLF